MLRARWAGHTAFKAQRLLVVVLAGVGFYFSFLWRIGTLLPGANSREAATIRLGSSWPAIWHNPVNAPYHITQYLFLKFPFSQLADARLSSAFILLLFTTCFYYVIRRWFGMPAAVFAVLLFITTPYAMILGRTATTLPMLLGIVAMALAFTWVIHSERRIYLAWFVMCLVCGVFLYVPGMVWLLAVSLALGRKELQKIFRVLPTKIFYIGLGSGLLVLAPMFWGLIAGRTSLLTLLWLPKGWAGILTILKYLGWSVTSIFVKTPYHTDYILGRSPMLTISAAVLVVFGVLGFASRVRQGLYWSAAIIVPSLILFAINQDITPLYFTLPIFVALAAVGMRFLYLEWRSIFPLNPIPRYLALSLIAGILILQVAYGFRYALVAWPNSPAAKTAYVLK